MRTSEQPTVFAHFGSERTEDWLLVRLEKPDEEESDGQPSASSPTNLSYLRLIYAGRHVRSIESSYRSFWNELVFSMCCQTEIQALHSRKRLRTLQLPK